MSLSPISLNEAERLMTLETAIERGFQTFVDVGNALLEIRDSRLYRDKYINFEEYCRARWNIERRRAYQLMDAAIVVQNVNNCTQIPANEAQARPLASLPPKEQASAWVEAINTAPNGKPTAAHVQSVVDGFNYKRDTKSTRPADIYTPQGFDACQTPPYAIDPLLPYLQEGWNIWEPAAGEGNLVEALYDAGFDQDRVIASDILTGQNFFEYEPPAWDCLVTNPPYSIKYKWLERCYELGKPFALLVPVETIASRTALEMFERFGFEWVFMKRRVDFKMPLKGWDASGAQFPTLWITWKLTGKEVTIVELNKVEIIQ